MAFNMYITYKQVSYYSHVNKKLILIISNYILMKMLVDDDYRQIILDIPILMFIHTYLQKTEKVEIYKNLYI